MTVAEKLSHAPAYLLTVPRNFPMSEARSWAEAVRATLGHVTVVAVQEPMRIEPLSHLDAAWHEAEQVLGPDWMIDSLAFHAAEWVAHAVKGADGNAQAFGDTPADALWNLAESARRGGQQ